MAMRLEFTYLPTPDLEASLRHFRDTLGFDELWREGEETVGLGIPGTDTALMVDAGAQPGWGPGPVFGVDSVADFRAGHDGLDVVEEPFAIPGGNMLILRDPAGNTYYVMDQSGDGA